MLEIFKNGSGIHIKEKNKGSFTKWCGGNVTDECIRRGKNSPNSKIRKKATFAANARKWKHKEGGKLGENKNFISKLIKAQYGEKLNFIQKAGNFLNSDTGKTVVGTIGQLYSGILNNINNSKLMNELLKWKESYINSAQPEDFSELIMREELQMKESNPDYNSSPIAIKFRENQLQQENLRLNKEKRALEADLYITNFILSRQNNNQSKSNIGDLLTLGLGYIGNYLGKNSNDTSSKLFTNTSGYSPISISSSVTAPSADSVLQKPKI